MKNKVKTNIVYEGHSFDSFNELSEFLKNDPNSDVLVWDYQERQDMVFLNGNQVLQGKQGRGKCTYKGETYEGEVAYIGNKLYVGGKYVKDIEISNLYQHGKSTDFSCRNKIIIKL